MLLNENSLRKIIRSVLREAVNELDYDAWKTQSPYWNDVDPEYGGIDFYFDNVKEGLENNLSDRFNPQEIERFYQLLVNLGCVEDDMIGASVIYSYELMSDEDSNFEGNKQYTEVEYNNEKAFRALNNVYNTNQEFRPLCEAFYEILNGWEEVLLYDPEYYIEDGVVEFGG